MVDASPASASVDAGEGAPPANALAANENARRLHPLTILQQVITSLPAVAVLLLPFLTTGADAEAWGSLLPAVAYGVIALPLIVLRYLRFRYWITKGEIVIRSGVVKTQHRSIPIERVQNVQVIHPLLPRLLGMAQVKVETAGSGSTEGTLEYVSTGEAERIREAVRAFQRQHGAAPAGAAQPASKEAHAGEEAAAEAPAREGEHVAEETLYEMPLGRVLLSGAFRFSLALIALIATGLQYTGFDDPDVLARLFQSGPLRTASDAVMASPYLAAAFAVLFVSLLSWLTGIALNLNRYYGFRLWREGHGPGAKLHYRRGLLTVSEGTIPLEKVQAVILRTNPLMRFFGWFILEVQTMGVQGSNHRTAVPLAKKSEVLALAQRIRPLALPERFSRVSTLTIRRATVRFSLALAVLVGAGGLIGGLFVEGRLFWHGAYWIALCWPLVPAYAYLRYRNLGYALSEEGLLVRRGVLRHRIWLLPTEKQQVFYTTASLFQRRLGLKSLYLDTAGAGGLASPEVADLPAAEADERLRQLYARFQQRFA